MTRDDVKIGMRVHHVGREDLVGVAERVYTSGEFDTGPYSVDILFPPGFVFRAYLENVEPA